jgi:lysylphosphatidylglycerol synthetase-like protein (DUF2156 family)
MCGAGSQRLIHAQEHRHLHQRTRAQPIMLASNVHVAVFSAVLLTLRRGYYLRGDKPVLLQSRFKPNISFKTTATQ